MTRADKIAEIQAKALESEEIALTTNDPDVQAYNFRLAEELREFAAKLIVNA